MEGQESLACCSSWGLKELGMTEYCILYIVCLYIDNCILSPSLFKLYAEYIMRNAGLEEAQAGIKISREISITSDMQMTPPLWQKVKKN